jgi:hypothetical protein
MAQDTRRQFRARAPAVGLAHDRLQRPHPDPVTAALVVQQVSPAACPRRLVLFVSSVHDRAGARDDHDPRGVFDPGDQGGQRVVDHENPAAVAEPAHDRPRHPPVFDPIDAGHAEADRVGGSLQAAARLLHDVVQHLLDLQFRVHGEVRTVSAGLGQDLTLAICQQADSLRGARVDSQDVHRA